MPEIIKPRPWKFDPGLTAPEWDWFWDSAILAFPLWEDGSHNAAHPDQTIYDVAQGFPATGTTAGGEGKWSTTKYGPAWQTLDSTKGIQALNNGGPIINATPFTLGGMFNTLKGSVDSTEYWLTYGTDATNRHISFLYRPDVGGDPLKLAIFGGGSVDFTGPLEVGRDYFVVGTFDGDTLRLYVDGLFIGSIGSQTLSQSAGDDDFYVGGHSGAGFSSEIKSSMAFCAEACFTYEQVKALSRDPFGPFRMADDVPEIVGGPAAATTTQWIDGYV